MTTLPHTLSPPQCLLQRLSHPSKEPLPSICESQPSSTDTQPQMEDNLPAWGGDVVILGVAAEEEEESRAETMGMRGAGTLLPSTPWGCL